jgi:K+-sensing histidine kinase KdpD
MDALDTAVIHDVKNQLAELSLMLERRGNCSRETSLILKACNRLTELLLVNRQQAGLLQANIDSANPVDLLKELASEYRIMFPGIDIVEDSSKAPQFSFYDESLVRLALANALHNACRHAKSSVNISVSTDADYLIFEIRDDGDGFPEGILKQTLAEPLPINQTGTGLGLWLAGSIAGLHQLENRRGQVTIKNADGGCFRMRLP